MQIATDLYAALQSFFHKYKDYRKRPLFITGESYAGKYVPSIGVSSRVPFVFSLLEFSDLVHIGSTWLECVCTSLGKITDFPVAMATLLHIMPLPYTQDPTIGPKLWVA